MKKISKVMLTLGTLAAMSLLGKNQYQLHQLEHKMKDYQTSVETYKKANGDSLRVLHDEVTSVRFDAWLELLKQGVRKDLTSIIKQNKPFYSGVDESGIPFREYKIPFEMEGNNFLHIRDNAPLGLIGNEDVTELNLREGDIQLVDDDSDGLYSAFHTGKEYRSWSEGFGRNYPLTLKDCLEESCGAYNHFRLLRSIGSLHFNIRSSLGDTHLEHLYWEVIKHAKGAKHNK